MIFYGDVSSYISRHNINYVSFDLYDTLIFRALHKPDDVWTLLHKRYAGSNPEFNLDIKRIRVQGEAAARKKKKSEDVTIDDIYLEIDLDSVTKETLKKIECDIEIEVSMPNRVMIDMLDKLRNKGFCILITTDMYLDEKTIRAILDKNQIAYDHLYISGQVGLRKETGNLFKFIIEDLGISTNDIIHIGDNKCSDVDNPRGRGIKSFLYLCKESDFEHYLMKTRCGYLFLKMNLKNRARNKIKRCFQKIIHIPCDDILSNYFVSYLNAVYKSEMSSNVRLGFCTLGPLLTAFCYWIHEKKIKEGIDQIWFVAREGYLIKNVYTTLYPDEGTSVKYVRYNKNICRMPFMLSVDTVDDFIALLPAGSSFTINDLLKLFLVDNKEEVLKAIEDKTGYTARSAIDISEFGGRVFKKIWKIIVHTVNNKAKEQRDMLIESLKEQMGDVGNRPKIALVNNSINGSIQYMLEKITAGIPEISPDFYGFQIVDSDLCRTRKIKYAAWLKDINNSFYTKFFNRTLNIFERLLFENCGTALYLARIDGRIQTVCEERRTERKNDAVLLPVQDKVIQFAEAASHFKDYDITQDALAVYFQMMSHPLPGDVKIIGELAFDEINETGNLINRCKKSGLLKYLKKARKEIWPNGFLVLNEAPKIAQDIFIWRNKINF